MLAAGLRDRAEGEGWGDLIVALIGYSAVLYPWLALSALAYLAILAWAAAGRRRMLAIALGPVVGLPVIVIFVVAGAYEALPWILLGGLVYGVAVRPHPPRERPRPEAQYQRGPHGSS